MQAANNSCFVVGYTGEVGKELVKELLTRKVFSRVTLIGRREVQYSDELFKDVVSRSCFCFVLTIIHYSRKIV